MQNLQNIQEQFNGLKTGVLNSLRGYFPIVGKKHELTLDDIWVDDNLSISDYGAQVTAYEKRGDFAVPVYGALTLRDIGGGVVDKTKKIKLMALPKITSRGTYMLSGNEYQVPYQLRLKPNVYNRIKANGELETFINIKPVALHLYLDPEKATFALQFGSQKKVSLYHFLVGLGVSDVEMAAKWGDEVVAMNKKSRGNPIGEVEKFFEMAYARAPLNSQEAVDGVLAYLSEKKLDKEASKMTVGTAHDKMSAQVLIDSALKLINLNKGTDEPDERDAVHFKHIAHTEDFIVDRLENEKRKLLFKIRQRIDSKDSVRDIIKSDVFDNPVHSFFTTSSTSNSANMLNPLAALAGNNKVTIMGEGGIEDDNAITEDARIVHPSQLGFIDPIHTPEGHNIGAVNQMALGAHKRGTEIVTKMYNVRTGKIVEITPMEASQSVVAFADQYDHVGGVFKPRYPTIKASVRNVLGRVPNGEVDFALLNDKQIFSVSSNLAPFLNHISGNRSMMSGKHMEQALPLKYREAPLVQNQLSPGKTFEQSVATLTNTVSDVNGIVKSITPDGISVIDKDGKVHKHNTYDKFISPSDKVYLHNTAKVAVGDKVKVGTPMTESNYTSNGTYAMGSNMTVAFTPYKGYTFEDGIAVSEAGAKKLTSLHIYKEKTEVDANSILNKKQYLSYYPTRITSDNMMKLGDDGVILEGQIVKPNDTLIAHLHKEDYTKEDMLLAQFNKKFLKAYKDRSLRWEEDFEGKVVRVIRRSKEIEVQVETEEAARVGDKLAGRAGNKGIITHIINDNDVPVSESGAPIDIFLNPHGVAGRINPAQVLETFAGKIADKTGKPYVVNNFAGINYNDKIQQELAARGIPEKERLKTPSGEYITENPVAVGKMHVLKLNHPVRKKFQARESNAYTIDMQPTSGGGEGGRKMDQLSIYSMLSHGATSNLQEAMTYKGEKNDDFWQAYQAGLPLPAPKVPFVFDKFQAMLKASGINTERKGDAIHAMPLTDEQLMKMSKGEIKEPEFIQGKNLTAIKGGLFDPDITGGREGKNWSHIELAEDLPNPSYEGAIISLLDLKKDDYDNFIAGKSYVNKNGIINSEGRGVTGGPAIRILLSKINIDGQLPSLEAKAKSADGAELNKIHKKIRYLKALKELKMDPTVYMSKNVPVLPPIFRPITPGQGSRLNITPSNPLYRDLMLINNQLKKSKENGLPQEEISELRKNLYQSYGSLVGTEKGMTDSGQKEQQGFLQLIAGKKPKEGFFQDKMLAKRQDFSGTSTIVPEPSYGLDEIGLPAEMLWSVYKPHVVRRLRQLGYSPNAAIAEVESRTQLATQILEQETKARPAILNRAPSLHKFSLMAFNPRVVDGRAIKVNPLIVGGYNADFDGDTMGIHVPISEKAVEEARKMMPSQNLFDPQSWNVMHKPAKEQITGLYMMTSPGDKSGKSYKTYAEAIADYRAGVIKVNSQISIGGKNLTLGSVLVNSILPERYRDYDAPMTGQRMTKVLSSIAKDEPREYAAAVSGLKNLGNEALDKLGLTISLSDLMVDYKARDQIVRDAQHHIDTKGLPGLDKFVATMDKFNNDSLRSRGSDLSKILDSGGDKKSEAIRQMTSSPFITTDHKNRVIPVVIGNSYTEGLDAGSYFQTLSGSRRGMMDKSLSTAEPGAFNKEIINTVIGSVVKEDDCGTHNGIDMPLTDRAHIIGRYTTDGQLIDDQFLKNYRNLTIKVRSPLTCEAKQPPCAKCFGLDETGKLPGRGTYLGTIAGQSMTEPATQLIMKKFHTGGALSSNKAAEDTVHSGFARVEELLSLPKILRGKSTLSDTTGTITNVMSAPQGGNFVYVNGNEHYVPGGLNVLVKPGSNVERGDRLSSGAVKPQELSDLKTPLDAKRYMVDEMAKAYQSEGRLVRKPLFETVVSSLVSRGRIVDPGKSDLTSGDYVNLNKIDTLNKAGAGIKSVPVFSGLGQAPLQDEDFIARLNFQRLKDTLTEAPAQAWKSELHGTNPIPGLVYGAEFGVKK